VSSHHPYAQWFDPLGACPCGKKATGTLRSFLRNESLGTRCEQCAKREIARAHKLKKFAPDALVIGSQS
jgi:hypothetical protein